MEMSKGVSLLRTAQSLLTGRTISEAQSASALHVNFAISNPKYHDSINIPNIEFIAYIYTLL